ncbi:hypothetical protein H9P43_001512 [Blastocladiella emersonii ATCC 22665]|nr:hypothetical protein H9P43_001512 [Blastocladiella emersonii ATCC 22665]
MAKSSKSKSKASLALGSAPDLAPAVPPTLHHAASESALHGRIGRQHELTSSMEALDIEDDEGGAGSKHAVALRESPADADAGLIESGNKDSFFSFLKSILGKDIDSVRINVPLFLLEPYSNLEFMGMLEDLEFFVQAPTQPTPLERMVSVVTVLITSLKKAMAKAKKPINPVLGEVFYAHFDAPEGTQAATIGGAKGPLPTTHLVAEQISHHPPISAFHLECPATQVGVTLIHDIKAKYNGLSFALQNSSYATLNMPAHGEEYHITYPDANLIGVLTLSFRLLWTGSCTVTCAKSNLQTTITFKEKRWFGRETHELAGTITPIDNPKKVLATIGGEWTGLTTVTYAGDKEPTPLFDASNSASPYTGTVVPDAIAPDNTSHAVWGDVMAAMRAGDSGKAHKLKTDIENKQRKIAKDREDGKVPPYVPVFFAPDDQGRVRYVGPKIPPANADYKAFTAAAAAATAAATASGPRRAA